jgi:hypothetical protein
MYEASSSEAVPLRIIELVNRLERPPRRARVLATTRKGQEAHSLTVKKHRNFVVECCGER